MSFGSPCVRVSPHSTPKRRPPFVSKTTKSADPISQAIRCCHASQSPRTSDPHTGHVPIRFRGLPIQPPSSKNPTLISERPASGAANPQPTLTIKRPEPASHLRKFSASQVQQILHTCDWGVAGTFCAYVFTGMRTAMYAYIRTPWSYLHGHTRIFTRTVMVILVRVCSHLYGHGIRARLRRDQRGRL